VAVAEVVAAAVVAGAAAVDVADPVLNFNRAVHRRPFL
jgi:hypothetical protein